MPLKQLVTYGLSTGLLASAAADPSTFSETSRDAPSASDCISAASIRDYRVPDEPILLGDVVHQRHYQIMRVRPSTGLRFAEQPGFVGWGGRICSGMGEIVVRDGHRTESIRVDTVFRLPEAQVAATGSRSATVTKGPVIEQGSPPNTVGAELEELDWAP